jgi:phosphoenolpyruvate carboxylase
VFQLSMWRCSDELRSRVQQIEASNRKDSKHYMGMGILVL